MDHNTHRRPASRQPLGDATQRLNHVTVNPANGSYEIGDVENHISSALQSAPCGHSNLVPILKRFPSENHHYHTLGTTTLVGSGQATACSALSNPGPQGPSDVRRVSQISNVSSNASSTRQIKTFIGPWQLGKTLGKGSSARVRLARHRVSHQLVAIKIVAKSTAHITQAGSLANLDSIDCRKPTTNANGGIRRMPLAIEREVAILKLIRHPNIIELQDIWENSSEIYLVTEYVEKGDLFEFINWNGPLQEEEAIFYFRQIMAALDYCHSFNICHRDLKPENILLKANGQIKIADFGMAALQQNPSHQLRTACGSPHYAAPELLRHQVYKGSAVDIWSMGVILYAMLAGRLPFDDHNLEIMMMKAKRAEYKMPPHLSREAKDLIRRILVDQPTHRITMKQMWRHALIRMYEYLEEYQKWDGKSPNTLRNMSNTPAPKEIDTQILRQLRALWHSYSESALQGKLREEKPNDQKLFYWLLYDHREAQLENYNNNFPISNSDFHHLKPPNWGKRISTCQFTKPARNGHTRTLSKFTVISNVPDIDEVGTVRSYDPYNTSRILKPCGSQVSRSKIIIHRNNPEPGVEPSPTTVSHSSRSYQSVKGSSYQRTGTNPRCTSTAGQLRSPKTSMGSIHNHQSNPRIHECPAERGTLASRPAKAIILRVATKSSALSKETLVASELSNFNGPNSQITENLPLSRPQIKKLFGLALWKGAKHEMKNSFAGTDSDDIKVQDEKKTRRRSSKEPRMPSSTANGVWSESDGGIRKIEVQQNWLARLFRVKPAMRYLCFNILRRRARQEMAILLREWRKYGIRDVEVDKQRNIIFARVGAKNYLNLKEVSFAIELMAVIEHGKRNQLTIARFTQEKGAASSFHRVVDGINAAFGTRALLIMDKRKIRMMIKTITS
ncbi:hypothetical protein VTI28DRAFT_2061 [Corynascus sepedonium]